MDIRTINLAVHLLPTQAYWVVSVDRGRGARYVVARGVLPGLEEPQWAPTSLVLREAVNAALEAFND